MKKQYPPNFQGLLQLAQHLRDPDKGCPWDKELTLKKMKKHLLEETNEIIKAIDKNDQNNLKEEIGDTLFNIAMLITIAQKEKLFSATSVFEDIHKKIINRHTWVFGEDTAQTAEEAYLLWQKNKEKEKSTQ